MDSLFLTGLPDSLSLQEMLDCDIKTEMDVDDCFSLGELPPLALDDSLDTKWDLIDPAAASGMFPKVAPLHSPNSEMTMWFNGSGSGVNGVGAGSGMDLDPSMMVNPSSVMPFIVHPTPDPVKPLVTQAPLPSHAVPTTVGPHILGSTHASSPAMHTTLQARAKISASSLNFLCNSPGGTPIAIVRATAPQTRLTHVNSVTRVSSGVARVSSTVSRVATQTVARVSNQTMARLATNATVARLNSVNAAAVARSIGTSTLSRADSNMGMSVRSAAPSSRCKQAQVKPLTDFEGKEYPKPAYSYSCLIALALKNSSNGSLPVSEIYNFMCEHFPYFKTAPNGWKNSVRHNLSLNKCFEKIEKPTTSGGQRKGCLWAMNPSKMGKMDEEVQKWSRKDPSAIRRAMINPEQLEMLERGEMKRELPSSSTLSGEDTEEDEEEGSDLEDGGSPPISPADEQPFTPPDLSHVKTRARDPIGTDDFDDEDEEFVDISALDQLGDQSLSEFDLDVNEGLYDELEEEERINLGINIRAPSSKIQGNYIYKPTGAPPRGKPMVRGPPTPMHSSYVCKPTSTGGTTVRIRKVQPAILMSTLTKRQPI